MRRDDHSSGTRLAARLTRPTRAAERECPWRPRRLRVAAPAAPIRSCSRWGLPCRPRYRGRGALLPHRFTLARSARRSRAVRAVCFLWHCPWGRPRRPLAGTVFPRSPDFPPPRGGSYPPAAAAVRPSGRHADDAGEPAGQAGPAKRGAVSAAADRATGRGPRARSGSAPSAVPAPGRAHANTPTRRCRCRGRRRTPTGRRSCPPARWR
jgi:hypothetical protein